MTETFNEQAFQEFLNSDSNKPFKVGRDVSQYTKGKSYIKVYKNEDFDFLIKFDEYNFGELEEIRYVSSSYSNGLDLEAIYFKKINTIVYEKSYEDVLSSKCKGIKIYYMENLYEQILESFNNEFENRRQYLNETFKNERSLIEEKKKNQKDTVLREYFGIIENNNKFISEYKFNDIKNRKMIYEYLVNPETFINEFVDNYIKNTDNLDSIKHIVCYKIALNELLEEIKDNDYIKKTKKIFDLLQTDLKEAKNIRLIDKDSNEFQVANRFYDLNINIVSIGDWRNNLDIDDIVYIKYGRKKFKVSG